MLRQREKAGQDAGMENEPAAESSESGSLREAGEVGDAVERIPHTLGGNSGSMGL